MIPTIRQDVRATTRPPRRDLSSADFDVVLVEHEYGIFGGEAGEFVVALAEELTVPLVVTLHTVLSDPSPQQAATSARTLRPGGTGHRLHRDRPPDGGRGGPGDAERVRVVPHGAPTVLTLAASPVDGDATTPGVAHLVDKVGDDTRARWTGWRGGPCCRPSADLGLQGAGTGRSGRCRRSSPRHPDVLYLIAGQTHPEVVKHEGESYRLCLERLVHELDLTEHVAVPGPLLVRGDELAVLLALPTSI